MLPAVEAADGDGDDIADADNAGRALRDISNASFNEQQQMIADAAKPNAPHAVGEQQAVKGGGGEHAAAKVSYAYYKRISNMLVVYLQREQEVHEEHEADEEQRSVWRGMRASELTNWQVAAARSQSSRRRQPRF